MVLVKDERIQPPAAPAVAMLRALDNTKPALKPAQLPALITPAAIASVFTALGFPLAIAVFMQKVLGRAGAVVVDDTRLQFWALGQWIMMLLNLLDKTPAWPATETDLVDVSDDEADDTAKADDGPADSSAQQQQTLRRNVYGQGTGPAPGRAVTFPPASTFSASTPLTLEGLAQLGANAGAVLSQQSKRDPIYSTPFFSAREGTQHAVSGSTFNLLGVLTPVPVPLISITDLSALCQVYLHCLLPHNLSRHGGVVSLLPYRADDTSGKHASATLASLQAFKEFERSVQPKLNHAEKEQFWEFIQLLTKVQSAFGWIHTLHYALLAMELAVEANDPLAVTELKMGVTLIPFVQDVQRRSQHAASQWALPTQGDRGQVRGPDASTKPDGKRQRREYDSAPRRDSGAPPRREQDQHEHAGERVSDRGRGDARVPMFRFDPLLTCPFHELPGMTGMAATSSARTRLSTCACALFRRKASGSRL
jgi:broad specificity phosphatase PhoE